jgi:hypothetical protein
LKALEPAEPVRRYERAHPGEMTFHLNNHSLLKAEVLQIREFLEAYGVAPDAFSAVNSGPGA